MQAHAPIGPGGPWMTDDPTPDAETPPPMPRWVKLFLIIGVILLLLLGVLLLTGDHGPGGHAPGALPWSSLLAVLTITESPPVRRKRPPPLSASQQR